MYGSVKQIFRAYWLAYGGSRALVRSPYLHLALIALVLTSHFWLFKEWWEQVLSVIPNLLGFTLGGFAVFLGFGDEKFRALLAEPDEDSPSEPTLYSKLCATFVHFIVIQSLALAAAVLGKSWDFYYPWPPQVREVLPYVRAIGGAIGYGLFLYALSSVIAATMHVFRIAVFYEQHQKVQAEINKAEKVAQRQGSQQQQRH